MTKTLRVDLADLEGIPHASGPSGTSVVVTAEYTSPVVLEADGTIILAPKSKTMGSAGRVDFDNIYASDSEEVREDHRGFAVRVKVDIREPNGATRTWARTVKPLEHMADTIRLGRMPSAEGLPPQWVTVEEVIGDFDARLDSLEDHPADHANRHATGGPDPITPTDIGAVASVNGNLPDSSGNVYIPTGGGGGGTGAVDSVNGRTGDVTLDADDVGALPSTYTPPAQSWDEVTDKPSEFPPSTHGHAYADITGTPTIPGPQTLSLAGTDLTLSGGGGTVTLPSGGGGGGFTPTVGSAPGMLVGAIPPSGSVSGTDTWRQGRCYVYPAPWYPVGGGSTTLTHAAIRVTTAVAESTVRVGIYGSTPDGLFDPTNLITDVPISGAVVANVEVALPAPVTLPPGIYWFATVVQGGVPRFNGGLASCTLGDIDPARPAVGFSRNGVAGALPTTATSWVGATEANGGAYVGWRVAA